MKKQKENVIAFRPTQEQSLKYLSILIKDNLWGDQEYFCNKIDDEAHTDADFANVRDYKITALASEKPREHTGDIGERAYTKEFDHEEKTPVLIAYGNYINFHDAKIRYGMDEYELIRVWDRSDVAFIYSVLSRSGQPLQNNNGKANIIYIETLRIENTYNTDKRLVKSFFDLLADVFLKTTGMYIDYIVIVPKSTATEEEEELLLDGDEPSDMGNIVIRKEDIKELLKKKDTTVSAYPVKYRNSRVFTLLKDCGFTEIDDSCVLYKKVTNPKDKS